MLLLLELGRKMPQQSCASVLRLLDSEGATEWSCSCRLDVKGSVLWLQGILHWLACQCLPILALSETQKSFYSEALDRDSENPDSD